MQLEGKTMPFTWTDARNCERATLTRAETADLLGVSVRTISESAMKGDIPSVRLGRRVLIPREPLVAMFTATSTETHS